MSTTKSSLSDDIILLPAAVDRWSFVIFHVVERRRVWLVKHTVCQSIVGTWGLGGPEGVLVPAARNGYTLAAS